MDRKRHISIVVGLLGLSCLVQVAVIRRATVTGLDAVRFVRIAESIDREGLAVTVRAEAEQPLFPAWLWVVHEGLQILPGESCSNWATAAQLAAAVPLVLAVVPLYLMLLRLVGTAAAAAGSFFFCLLPEVSRLGADGISDSTHLLFFCVAFWAMVEYVSRRGSLAWLMLAGLATATAALARAEVLVLAAAFAATLLIFQFLPERRASWSRLAAGATVFTLGLAVVLGPYLAAAGCTTPRTALDRLLGRHCVADNPSEPGVVPDWRLSDGRPVSFAAKEPSVSIRRRGYSAGLVLFGRKLADAFSYWIGALALCGLCRLGRGRATAADRFIQVFFVLFSLAAIRFTAAEGYLVPRHLLPLVVAGLASAGLGAVMLGSAVGRFMTVARPGNRRVSVPVGEKCGLAALAVVLLAGVACLPQTLMHLHYSRAGHRQAAQWLASADAHPGTVLDTQGWTRLYSGRGTYAFEEAVAALSDSQLAYLVFERQESAFDSDRGRTLRWLISAAARPVAEFPCPAQRAEIQQPVVVYRWYPDRFHRLKQPGDCPDFRAAKMGLSPSQPADRPDFRAAKMGLSPSRIK